MVITLNIQGASPEEIRETCKQFAEMAINNRIVVKPEDLGISQAPAPSPEVKQGGQKPRKRHYYNDGCISDYRVFQMAGWDHLEAGVLREVAQRLRITLVKTQTGHHWRVPEKYVGVIVDALRQERPRNLNVKQRIYQPWNE